jgi:hypothetical protein
MSEREEKAERPTTCEPAAREITPAAPPDVGLTRRRRSEWRSGDGHGYRVADCSS